MRLYVVWAETAVCEVCVFCYYRRHRRISEGGAGAGHSKTGGVARLEQADDGATT